MDVSLSELDELQIYRITYGSLNSSTSSSGRGVVEREDSELAELVTGQEFITLSEKALETLDSSWGREKILEQLKIGCSCRWSWSRRRLGLRKGLDGTEGCETSNKGFGDSEHDY